MSEDTGFKPLKLPPPHEPADASKGIVHALKKLHEGTATPHQQKIALRWIIQDASRANQPAYIPGQDGQRDTEFALGRAFVGQQIIGLLKVNVLTAQGD